MNNEWSYFLSSEQLADYRGKSDQTQAFGSIGGQKDNEVDGSGLQISKLEEFYSDYKCLLLRERVQKQCSVDIGYWHEEKHLVELEKEQGKYWFHMGFTSGRYKWLYPEEALFLMETNALQVFHLGLPLSIQEGYSTFIESEPTIDEYRVFSHLSRLSFIVKRHNPARQSGESGTVSDDFKYMSIEEDASSGMIPECPLSERSRDSPPSRSSEDSKTSIPFSRWNFDDVKVPDVIGKPTLLLWPPNRIHIPHVDLSTRSYEVNVASLAADSCTPRRRRRDDAGSDDSTYSHPSSADEAKHSARNWSEYKLAVSRRLNWNDNDLWSGKTTPLIHPSEMSSSSNIQKKLDIFQKPQYTSSSVSRFKVSFDVYLPNAHFKKSHPGKPNQRVCIARLEEDPPTLEDMVVISRQLSDDGVPIIWAVVGSGVDISFINFLPVTISHKTK